MKLTIMINEANPQLLKIIRTTFLFWDPDDGLHGFCSLYPDLDPMMSVRI
jgi:hypothetical protein